MDIALRLASGAADIEQVRRLFREYQKSLGIDLCFQGFQQELATLPGAYAAPQGRLYLACEGASVAGCVGLRPHDVETAEMKRLYVPPDFRGRHIGRALAQQVINDAARIGYRQIKLDTLPTMTEAHALYLSLGFHDIAPYTKNPVQGVRFMGLALSPLLQE